MAVFDTNQARVVKYLAVAEDNIKFAAGMTKLMVVLNDSKVLQRWSLITFEREVSVPLTCNNTPNAVAMGPGSSGPLLIQCGNGFPKLEMLFYDINEMKPVYLSIKNKMMKPARYFRASLDGRFIGFIGINGSGSGLITLNNTEAKVKSADRNSQAVSPSPDGSVLFTSQGICTTGMQLRTKHSFPCVPALQGEFYLGITFPEQRSRSDDQSESISLCMQGDSRALLTLPPDIQVTRPGYFSARQMIPQDRWVFFIPDADLIITVPITRDQLVLHRFNVDEALEKSNIDYLFVKSTPLSMAQRGKGYIYSLNIKSKKGGVTSRLDFGPPSMTLAENTLRWNVPNDFANKRVDVILTLRDKSGQEILHTFVIDVMDKLPEFAKAPPEKVEIVDPSPEKVDFPEQPPVAQSPLQPPDLEMAKVIRKLPGLVGSLRVGGNGRFIGLHLPRLRKIALFDVNEAKIVHYFPIAEEEIAFAMGMDKLFVINPTQKVVQRYDLYSREREVIAPLDIPFIPTFARMGSASRAYLVVAQRGSDGNQAMFFDAVTLKPKTIQLPDVRNEIRISANGAVLTSWATNSEPMGIRSYVLMGDDVKNYSKRSTAGHLVPGPDGSVIYTSRGRFTNQVKKMGGTNGACYPAVHGRYYMNLMADRNTPAKVTFFMQGTDRPLVTHTLADISTDDSHWGQDTFGLDHRILFIPDAKVFITVPDTNDRLVVERFDMEEVLEKSGIDYLLVTSRPNEFARRGSKYEYQMNVKSKKGGVKIRLKSGPQGMSMNTKGKLTWNVPDNFAESQVDIVLSVADSTGQELSHTFKLNIGDELPADQPEPEPGDKAVAPEPKKEQPLVKTPDPMPGKEPALAQGLNIIPPKMTKPLKTLQLPGTISKIVAGGGGRYLIFHLPQKRLIGIFDANAAKVVKYLPTAESDVALAAGRDKLLVALPNANVIQRYSLTTFEREVTVSNPFPERIKSLNRVSGHRRNSVRLYLLPRLSVGSFCRKGPLTFGKARGCARQARPT